MVDLRCPLCKNRHSCAEMGLHALETCGMFVLDDPPKRPQTNADRIRAMTNKQLAKACNDYFGACPPVDCPESNCEDVWLDWLKSPAEEGA